MSISQTQTKNLLDFIARSYYSAGINPQLKDILDLISKFNSDNPVGSPYRMPAGRFKEGLVGDETDYNDLMAILISNIDTLYEVCFDHIDQAMYLNTVLQNNLDRLKKKRAKLEDKIDDYLLGIYNSDGYFYSASDDFSEASGIDFQLSDALLDTAAGVVTLPSQASGTRIIPADKLSNPHIVIRNNQGKEFSYVEKMPFSNAIDGLTNTAWHLEVKTTDDGPLTLELSIDLSTALGDTKVTRVELTPYGIEPTKVAVLASYSTDSTFSERTNFSNAVKTSADKMIFTAETNTNKNITQLHFMLSKNKRDYTVTEANTTYNVFMFGIRELLMTENAYDHAARLVSKPITIPTSIAGETSIDSVSLTTVDHIPNYTSITYYVAEDVENPTSINSFDWKQINPVGWSSDKSKNVTVKFGGAKYRSIVYRQNPVNDSDRQIPTFNTTDIDIAKRNPTSAYFPGIDVYRIGDFGDDFLSNTLTLEEGINTTKIYYTNLDAFAIQNGFAFWKEIFDEGDYSITNGRIDTGHGFFYGGDIGSNGKSVYCETYLNLNEQPTGIIQKDCIKLDSNAQLWTIKVFLNGREVAYMPPGVNRFTIPWNFKKGRNHIVVMVNIPGVTPGYSPYVGTFDLMKGDSLMNYGSVNLDYLTYVDNYKFVNNQLNPASTFTIYNDQLVTRRQITDNYKLTYYQKTNSGPEAIRVRADLTRSDNMSSQTPILDSYRVRFSYESV